MKSKSTKRRSPEENNRLVADLQVREEELQKVNQQLRLAQEEILTSRDRYVELYDSSPVGYVTLNDQYIITEINLTLARMLNTEKNLLIGSSLIEWVLLEDQSNLNRHLSKVFQTGSKQECELRLMKSDRSIFYAQLESVGMKHNGDRPKQCLTSVIDIGERVEIQNALRNREIEISAILDSTPMLMLVLDPARQVVKSNLASAQFAGRKTEEMIGLRAGEALRCLHSLDAAGGCGSGPFCPDCLVRRTVLDTIETGRSHFQVEWKLPFIRENKTEDLTFYLYTVHLDLPQNETLVFIQDISEIKKSEERIQSLNTDLTRRAAELEAVNKELEAFSYSVSHDLKAPLRAMDGFSEAILEEYADKLDSRGQDYFRRIRESSQLMSNLIDDLLNLSRVARAEMHLEQVDLSQLASEVTRELRNTQPERKAEFSIEPGLQVFGDRHLLKVVFDNLLGNAFKFTGKHPETKIEFGATDSKIEKVFFVRDNGTGFDMAYADDLFKPFHRLHSARDFPGTGIGLASVQRIINRLGGRIWAESELGKGATFYFTLNQY